MQDSSDLEERILARLTHGPATSAELQARLEASQATISRALKRLRGEVLPFGQARARRYAQLWSRDGLPARQPLYRIDADANVEPLGELVQVWGGYVYRGEQFRSGHYDGLPWFLRDQCPQGFLGRRFPARYPELDLPLLRNWQDEHFFHALALRGDDLPGDLLLGEASMQRWLAADPAVTPLAQLPQTLLARAEALAAGAPAQSSAAGEQPKFTLVVADGDSVSHRLVKYSPPLDTPAGRRWADLLLAEHRALHCLAEAGYAAMPARLHEAGNRRFLDSERYDRVGRAGRRPMFSLAMISAEVVGLGHDWTAIAAGLLDEGLLRQADLERVVALDLFGELIANTDRHAGNLALVPDGQRFSLAPVYDMLPMAWAPHSGGEVPTLQPRQPGLKPGMLRAMDSIRPLARHYWAGLAEETELSPEFRRLARLMLANPSLSLKGA